METSTRTGNDENQRLWRNFRNCCREIANNPRINLNSHVNKATRKKKSSDLEEIIAACARQKWISAWNTT
jgi:hypothetical protein